MKKFTFYLFVLSMGLGTYTQAQETTTAERIEALEQRREAIIAEEKAFLKEEVEEINRRLEREEIDWEEAEKLKGEAANKRALNIKRRVAPIDKELRLLRGKDSQDWEEEDWEEEDRENDDWFRKSRYSRTSTHIVTAVGFNNALAEGQSMNDSDFKVGGSRFFEIGIAWRTRVFEKSNWLRLRYGASFQFNGLKPTQNRYFVENGDNTDLQLHPQELEKSKFRMDNLVFPVHFEFGPSNKIETDRSVWFSTKNKLKIGLGGYAGFSIGERQKLKYEENGEDIKNKLKGDYNTNDFIYGLSGYLGWGSAALYMKYDLNPIFEDPNPELHNVSLGLRFDID